MANRGTIAEAAGVPPCDVSTAFGRLTEIGALIRIRPGRYRVNPHVGWSGPLHKREIAGKASRPVVAGPSLVVVDGGKP